MHGAHAAVHRGIVVLATGGNADQLRFDVLRDDANLFQIELAPVKRAKRGAGGDHQRRRAGDARPGRRFRIGFQHESAVRLEEANQMGRQRVLVGLRRQQCVQVGEAFFAGRYRGTAERISRPSRGVILQAVRMFSAMFTLTAPGWKRYNGQMSSVPPARSARHGAVVDDCVSPLPRTMNCAETVLHDLRFGPSRSVPCRPQSLR